MQKRLVDDTTLRDGMQMPGIRAPSPEERLSIAQDLSEIGVDRLEMFGTWYDIDRLTAKMILEAGLKSRIAIWVRASKDDIDDVIKSNPATKEVGISHPVSDIHLQDKLEISRDEAFTRIMTAVEYVHDHGMTCFVHGEDSTRADWEFEKRVIQGLVERKVECYRICDTVGVGIPSHMAQLEDSRNGIPLICKCIPDKIMKLREYNINLEFHGHDDLGNAVTNTLVALQNGAKWASTTILGMGERSGNAETEKVIMNLVYHFGAKRFKTELLTRACQKVSKSMDIRIPNNKALVGPNVFTHSSGIHGHGVLKSPVTYEFIPPESVGNERKIFLGPYSGKAVYDFLLAKFAPSVPANDPRREYFIDYVRNTLFGKGLRRSAITDEELKYFLRMFALIQ